MNIKGMDKDMRCRGFQFEIGKEYKIENNGEELELCTDTVFHYCKSLQQVHKYYSCDDGTNRYFEIEVLGEEITDGEKYGSNRIRILREITGEELNNLKGLNNENTGLFNSGYYNSGYRNSGDFNSGDRNSGNRNSGDWNSGDWNSGNRNGGDMNCGDMNCGNMNSGDFNSGDMNCGNMNCGNMNSGDRNSGNRNSGDMNSGDWNSGNRNSGDMNSGDWNSGDWNSGNRNSGDMNCGNMNSGIANKCDSSNGVFCNESDTNIRIFNKPSGMSLLDFYNSEYWKAMCSAPFNLTEWIEYTAEEKAEDPEKEKIGEYLKTYTYKEAWANWWNMLSDENKAIIQQIPNFDKKVFKDITGIEI